MQSMQKLNRLGVGSKGPMPMMPRVTTPRHLPKLAPNVREHINRRVESAGTNMKQLINKPEDTVREMIEGMVMCYPHLGFLDGIPDIKVLFDKKHDKNKVAIIGGRSLSGLELGMSHVAPATGGYVGEGMLAAAVCGEVFASPSAEAVLAAIRTVTGPGGCLIIVLNYTGDRLHFGLAVEQAKAEGLDVEMMFVGEDVAIETPGIAGRRGLAGTALVMKVAGAASASGKSLKEVTAMSIKAADSMATMGAALYVCTVTVISRPPFSHPSPTLIPTLLHQVAGAASASGKTLKEVTSLANKAADSMATMGAALYVCTLPGKETSDRLSSSEIEIGLGIHSEPGFVKADHMGVGELTQRLVAQMAASHHLQGGLNKDEPVALLVNNLGGSTQMEMMVAAREALNVLSAEYNVKVERVFVGQYVTSLDMRGLSLTVMKLGEGADRQTFTELLDMSTVAPGWPNSGHQATSHSSALVATPLPGWPNSGHQAMSHSSALVATLLPGRKLGEKPPKPEVVRPDSPSEAGLMLERCMKAASESVLAVAAELDELDGKVGDGDCGSTLSLGANAILADLAAGYYPIDDAPSTMVGVGGAIRRSMGGSSGGLYDIFFTAAARALKCLCSIRYSMGGSSGGLYDIFTPAARTLKVPICPLVPGYAYIYVVSMQGYTYVVSA
eukprot:gene5044-34833_t